MTLFFQTAMAKRLLSQQIFTFFFLFPFTRLSSVRNNSSESFDKLIKRATDANEVRYANASASYRLSTDAAGARANQTRKFITQLVE